MSNSRFPDRHGCQSVPAAPPLPVSLGIGIASFAQEYDYTIVDGVVVRELTDHWKALPQLTPADVGFLAVWRDGTVALVTGSDTQDAYRAHMEVNNPAELERLGIRGRLVRKVIRKAAPFAIPFDGTH